MRTRKQNPKPLIAPAKLRSATNILIRPAIVFAIDAVIAGTIFALVGLFWPHTEHAFLLLSTCYGFVTFCFYLFVLHGSLTKWAGIDTPTDDHIGPW